MIGFAQQMHDGGVLKKWWRNFQISEQFVCSLRIIWQEDEILTERP